VIYIVTRMGSFLQEEDSFEAEREENYTMTCAARGLEEANNVSLPLPVAAVLRVAQPLFFSIVAVTGQET